MSDYGLIPPVQALVDGVREFFFEQGITAVVDRGYKKRAQQLNQGPGRANRVVFLPSPPSGSAGRLVGPRQVGQRQLTTPPADEPDAQMRALADWQRLMLVSVWAFDGDDPTDEGAQDDAVYQLFVWTIRAVNAVAFGNAVWGAVNFTVPLERAFGLELLAELTLQHQMPDMPDDLVRPQAEIEYRPWETTS